jgi:outer membrane receptor for ferrienterochelin and colicins
VNIDRYHTTGGRAEFVYRLHPRFSFEAGISETGRKSSIEGTQSNQRYSFSTDITTNWTYNWLSRKLVMAVFYKYTGRLPRFYRDESGQVTEGYISSFHTMDVSVNKSFLSEKIILGIGGKNLFDYNNIESVGISSGAHTGGADTYPVGWGRTWYVSLKLQFSKY